MFLKKYKNASLKKKLTAKKLNKHYESDINLGFICMMSLKSMLKAFNQEVPIIDLRWL